MAADTKSLYERLGGADVVASIANDIVDIHMANPVLNPRFKNSNPDELKILVRDFFAMGTGGPNNYKGKDMLSAHSGMNINETEMISTIDDVMVALDKNGVGQEEKNEVLAILYSLKNDILHV